MRRKQRCEGEFSANRDQVNSLLDTRFNSFISSLLQPHSIISPPMLSQAFPRLAARASARVAQAQPLGKVRRCPPYTTQPNSRFRENVQNRFWCFLLAKQGRKEEENFADMSRPDSTPPPLHPSHSFPPVPPCFPQPPYQQVRLHGTPTSSVFPSSPRPQPTLPPRMVFTPPPTPSSTRACSKLSTMLPSDEVTRVSGRPCLRSLEIW